MSKFWKKKWKQRKVEAIRIPPHVVSLKLDKKFYMLDIRWTKKWLVVRKKSFNNHILGGKGNFKEIPCTKVYPKDGLFVGWFWDEEDSFLNFHWENSKIKELEFHFISTPFNDCERSSFTSCISTFSTLFICINMNLIRIQHDTCHQIVLKLLNFSWIPSKSVERDEEKKMKTSHS